jgi:azurin
VKTLFAIASLLLAGAAHAQAPKCSIDLKGDDMMKFDQSAITVSSTCKDITINLTHAGKLPVTAMGHNVVIAASDVYTAVAQDGLKAGPAANYVPAGDARVAANTKLVGGGETTSTTFAANKLAKGGAYTFFCSFPGHWAVMKGTLVVE